MFHNEHQFPSLFTWPAIEGQGTLLPVVHGPPHRNYRASTTFLEAGWTLVKRGYEKCDRPSGQLTTNGLVLFCLGELGEPLLTKWKYCY